MNVSRTFTFQMGKKHYFFTFSIKNYIIIQHFLLYFSSVYVGRLALNYLSQGTFSKPSGKLFPFFLFIGVVAHLPASEDQDVTKEKIWMAAHEIDHLVDLYIKVKYQELTYFSLLEKESQGEMAALKDHAAKNRFLYETHQSIMQTMLNDDFLREVDNFRRDLRNPDIDFE